MSQLNINKILNNEVIVILKDNFIAQNSYNIKKTQDCINLIQAGLSKKNISYKVIKRSQLQENFYERLVISVGGDGTLLDASHHCYESILLGVNSDKQHSIGALCTAFIDDFFDILDKIYQKQSCLIPINRLQASIDNKIINIPILNEVLFCHKNPASISKYGLKIDDYEEIHRSSGLFIATSLGSSGAIFSAGGKIISSQDIYGQFLVREFFWSDEEKPKLISGLLKKHQSLYIKNLIDNCKIYIDGAHKNFIVPKNAVVKVEISPYPVWLFKNQQLLDRTRLIRQRQNIRNFYFI